MSTICQVLQKTATVAVAELFLKYEPQNKYRLLTARELERLCRLEGQSIPLIEYLVCLKKEVDLLNGKLEGIDSYYQSLLDSTMY